jgi:hypothetical protein
MVANKIPDRPTEGFVPGFQQASRLRIVV